MLLVLLSLIAFLLKAAPAHAEDAGTRELSPLPEVPSLELAAPKADDLARVDGLLARLTDKDLGTRRAARRELLEAQPSWVLALQHRLNAIADRSDKTALRDLLQSIRDRTRDAIRKQKRAAGDHSEVETPDYLEMLTESPGTDSETWRTLVHVVAISRALAQIGTVEAVRELIQVYVRFGEFLRVDTQLQLARLGDRAIAALIETERHQAKKIATWANRQLDALGKAIPSEAVQTDDHEVLADVLRAYGRNRDPDAARIVISFANSERAQVRIAARQAIALMGEVSSWQLRDAYESVLGKKPRRDWTWERTARELFTEFDSMRLAQVHEFFQAGLLAQQKGDLVSMRTHFDKVLARAPNFEQRKDMVSGYASYAKRVADSEPEAALEAIERAERLSLGSNQEATVKSLRLTLEAKRLLSSGVVDQISLSRALELDPGNELASLTLKQLERGEPVETTNRERFAAAAAIFAAALLAIGFILFRKRTAAAPATGEEGVEPNR